MVIETTALTDFASLADPSATFSVRPGNLDFAPFLSVAAVANTAVTSAPQLTRQPGEAMLANMPAPGVNVALQAGSDVGKPTPANLADAGQEDRMLQSAFDIVQQLAASAVKPVQMLSAPAVAPVLAPPAPVVPAATDISIPAPAIAAGLAGASPKVPVKTGEFKAASAPDLVLPGLPGIKIAPKPAAGDRKDAAATAESNSEDDHPDGMPPVTLPAPVAAAPSVVATAPPAPVVAAIVSQDRVQDDAAPLPPKAGTRPAMRAPLAAAALPSAVALPAAELPEMPAAATALPLSDPVPVSASTPPVSERPASNVPAAAASPQPATAAPIPQIVSDKPAEHKAAPVQPFAQSDASGPVAPQQHAAAPAAVPVTNAPPAAAHAPAPVGPAIAQALDDLVVAGASDDQWVHRLASDIQTLASGDRREATLQLRPQELGGMAIRLEMEDRHTRVHFTVENSAARELIADAALRLQHLVEARGFQLEQTTVEVRSPSDTASANNNNGGSNANANSGSSAGTGSGGGRQGQHGAEPQISRAPRGATAAEAAAARALASGKFERFA